MSAYRWTIQGFERERPDLVVIGEVRISVEAISEEQALEKAKKIIGKEFYRVIEVEEI